jgi:hypothetical protein
MLNPSHVTRELLMFQGDISLPKTPFRKAPKEVVVCMGNPLFRSIELDNQNNLSNSLSIFPADCDTIN